MVRTNLIPKDHLLYSICKELFEKPRLGEVLKKIIIDLDEESPRGYNVFAISKLRILSMVDEFLIPADLSKIEEAIYNKITLDDLKKLPKYHSAWIKLTIEKYSDYVYEFTADGTILIYN